MAELRQEIAKVMPEVGREQAEKITPKELGISGIAGMKSLNSLQIYFEGVGWCPHWHFKFPIHALDDLA